MQYLGLAPTHGSQHCMGIKQKKFSWDFWCVDFWVVTGTHEDRASPRACTRQGRTAMSAVAVVEEWVCGARTPTAGARKGRMATKLTIIGRTGTGTR